MKIRPNQPPSNRAVLDFVHNVVTRCQPDSIHWINGTHNEREMLYAKAVVEGAVIPLNQTKLPGCFYHRSNPNDVARVEHLTYICTTSPEEAGPTNQWAEPRAMYHRLNHMLEGAMRGRTLYVIPYLMGPPGSPLARVGVELTDSIYVVLNMLIMTRAGEIAWRHLGLREDFNRGIHSLLDCDPERRVIAHFPEDNMIISVGSGYGGNALLGKKCMALRIGSYLGRQQGWMAEHMLILALESPQGEKTYIAAAFPSACGKTNLAMLIPPARFKGWKVTTLGDDIAWMEPGPDGRLYAINPENGYFGVAPGTSKVSNPNAMKTMARHSLYTNVALTPDFDVWWEGKDGPDAPLPERLTDWQGRPWTPESGEKAAHPNSRFTAPMSNNPALAPEAEWVGGVPISAIIFGGRRADTVPLVAQAFDWAHGVYMGASMGSETTAAAAGATGRVRRDPMAMLPFCGYHMGDYFQHWLEMGAKLKHPPQIFSVNWFRKDDDGSYLWPGFGENMRVLKWIVERCHQRASAVSSPAGWMPLPEEIDLAGLPEMTPARFEVLQEVNREEWLRETESQEEFFCSLGSRLPQALTEQLEKLRQRL